MTSFKRDRFTNYIPRENLDLLREKLLYGTFDETPTDYQERLAFALFGATHSNIRKASILNFQLETTPPKAIKRPYKLSCDHVIDVPEIADDYYFNPLCWGYPLIYIALGTKLYSYHPTRKTIGEISSNRNSIITSLAASPKYIVRADKEGCLQIIDTHTLKKVITQQTSNLYTQIIADDEQFYLLSKKDKMITHYDPRTNKFSFELKFPLQPIGMAYNPQPKTIGVCVGSGERQSIQIMDIRAINRDGQSNLLHTFKEHQSPSKALRFFGPNKIASGGGNNDRYIKIWDTRTGKLFSQAHTGGQVCNIHKIDANGLVTTGGYSAEGVSVYRQKEDQLILDAQIKVSDRVLFSAQNPADSTQIVTGSENEQIRMWSIKSPLNPLRKEEFSDSSSLSLSNHQIR